MPRLFVYSRKGNFSQLSLKGEKITIGRSTENDIVIKDPYSSNQHAFIYPSDRGYVLRDNNSKNGTFLNSERIQGQIELKKGDEILIGSTRIIFDKELSTNVELTREDSAVTNIHTILPLKDILEKTDISTTIRAKFRETDLDKIDKEYRLLSIINAVSQELLLHRPKHELIDKIMELINENLPMDRGTLMLKEGNPLQLQPKSICINDKSLMNKRFQVSQNILNMVMNKHSSLLIADVQADPKLQRTSSVIISNIHSAMCVPLWNNEEIIGVIYSDRIFLPEPFSDEDLRLLTLIANLAAVKIEDFERRESEKKAEEIRKQLELAAQIQRNFLPKESPKFEGFDIAGHNVPTYMVGGDYYDFIPLGPNRLGITIADVSGKGPSAAFHMVSFRTRLEVEAEPGYDIQEMTARLNDFVHRKTDTNRFISFFFCELNNLTGELKFVNAGHNPPIVIKRKGKTERLGSCGLCLGMFPSEKYEAGSVTLDRGDLAVLYTDGITECRNEDNKEFGERRFVNIIKKNSKCSAEELLDRIFKELDVFTQEVDQMDDITLVIIKRMATKI
jgi:serine phosphatase RsbU (regulator of sigma subunit)/pSer/pThr/pTyr-binding forkhead associated (FHA) protein